MEPAAPPKIHRVEVQWHAVTYKTVIVYGLLVALIVLAGMFIVFPSTYSAVTRKISTAMASSDGESPASLPTQAKVPNPSLPTPPQKRKYTPWVDAHYPTPP